MSEYVYCSHGEPLANDSGEIALAREEIVRCRDCMYFTPEREPETSGCFEILHPSFCDMHITKTEPDGFCSFSKRKEGERWQYSE